MLLVRLVAAIAYIASDEDETQQDDDKAVSSLLPILLYALAYHLACTFKNYLLAAAGGVDADVWNDVTFCLPTVTPPIKRHNRIRLCCCYEATLLEKAPLKPASITWIQCGRRLAIGYVNITPHWGRTPCIADSDNSDTT